MLLLWDVDTQIDFLAPRGRLYMPGAEKILPNLGRLTRWAAEHRVPIIASVDAHLPGDPELQIYGEHCMVGTPGQQKAPETLLPDCFVVPNRPIELPDLRSFQQIVIEKQAFDFSTNPNHRQVLRQFSWPPEIKLYGVATDICVAAAARSLLDLGHKVSLVIDAVAELDAREAQAFLREFAGRGGSLMTTADVMASCKALPSR